MSTTSETIYDAKEAEKQLHLDSDEKDAQLTENGREPGANHPEDAVLAIVESATGVRPPVDAHSSSEHEVDGEFTTNYAGGITLILAMVALNLSVFLMFLDNSIIATVSVEMISTLTNWLGLTILSLPLGHTNYYRSVPLYRGHRMVY